MTTVVAVLLSEGIIIATDSRQVRLNLNRKLVVDSDHSTKIFQFTTYVASILMGASHYYSDKNTSPKSYFSIFRSVKNKISIDTKAKEISELIQKEISSRYLECKDLVQIPRLSINSRLRRNRGGESARLEMV